MLRIVAFDSAMAVTRPASAPEMSVMSAASMATSVPVPMAMPTSAWASAGASLMPSPTMPDRAALGLEARRLRRPCRSGRTSASTRSTPTERAMASAVRRLSPVSMTTSRPRRRSAATAGGGVVFERVGHRDDTGGAPVDGDEHRGLAVAGERRRGVGRAAPASMPASSSSRGCRQDLVPVDGGAARLCR